MKQQTTNKQLNRYKVLVFFMVMAFITVGCQDELDSASKENTTAVNQNTPSITTLSLEQVDETFNRLKNDLGIDHYLRPPKSMGLMFRTTTDTLGLTIATDIIKQVTMGDYSSYTMKIIHENDSTVFYNLTIEYKNGKSGMFVTKYTPTAYWLDNKDSAYQGNIQSRKMNTLEEYIDPEDIFDEELWGDNNYDVGVGVGGIGGSYTPQTSPYYPTDCGGIVIVTMESVPYPCGCGDWPGDYCTGCNIASPQYPGYNMIPLYYCQDYGYGDPYDGPQDDTGSSTGGVSITDPDPDDGISIVAQIKPEECTTPLVGDLNGDCILSEYERCLINGYSSTVCNCVMTGSSIADCLDNDCNKLKAVTDVPVTNTRLYQLRTENSSFEKGFKVSKNPSSNSYEPSIIINNNTGNCRSVNIAPHPYTAVIAHTHPSCVYYKMFSAPDILKLANMAYKVQNSSNTTVKLTELTHILVFNDNGTHKTYALRFDDEASVQTLLDIVNNEKLLDDFNKKLQKDYDSDYNSFTFTNETDIYKQQRHLFKHLEKYNLNISLYEANFDTNGKVNHWKKINKDTLQQEDCN